MSNHLDDRLTAALRARADLVTPDDLRPLEIPTQHGHRRAWAIGIAVGLAAAATVVALPFLTGGDDGSDGMQPIEPAPTSPSSTGPDDDPDDPSATSETSQDAERPPDTRVADQQRADLDGDGRPDRVEMVVEDLRDDQTRGWLDVRLASGGTVSADLPEGFEPTLLPPYAINRDAHEQILLTQSGGDASVLHVYTLVDDQLVRADTEGKAPLALELDGEGMAANFFTDEEALHSWLRQDPLEPEGWPMFEVRLWTWSIDADRLIPTPDGRACVDASTEVPPTACPG